MFWTILYRTVPRQLFKKQLFWSTVENHTGSHNKQCTRQPRTFAATVILDITHPISKFLSLAMNDDGGHEKNPDETSGFSRLTILISLSGVWYVLASKLQVNTKSNRIAKQIRRITFLRRPWQWQFAVSFASVSSLSPSQVLFYQLECNCLIQKWSPKRTFQACTFNSIFNSTCA